MFRVRRVFLYLLAVVTLAGAVYLFLYFEIASRVNRPLVTWEGSREARQLASLRSYAERASQGSLLPPGDAVLAVREQFVREALRRSLPFRHSFEDGRYLARLDSADVHLESGVALVTLAGRGVLGSDPNPPIYADLRLQGFMVVENIDPSSGALRARIVVTDFRVRRAGASQLRALASPVIRYFSRLRVEDWNAQPQAVAIPIRIEREIVLPALEGDVSIAESRIPLAVSVSAVTTLAGRMVLSLALEPDTLGGEPAGAPRETWIEPASAVLLRTRDWIRGVLRAGKSRDELTAMRERVDQLAAGDPLWSAVIETNRDMVAVIPASLLRRITTRVSQRYLRGVHVDFAPELTEEIDEPIRVRILGKRVGAGRIRGVVHVNHIQGLLTARGEPQVSLVPPDEMVIDVPAQLVQGSGRIRLDVEWDPSFLVGVICKSFTIGEALTGDVRPLRHELSTRIRFAVYDSMIAGRPRVQRDRIRLSTDLSDASWDKIRTALVAQDRFDRCGIVMDPEAVVRKLQGLTRKGIQIRLPSRIFQPFRLPVALDEEYEAGDYRIQARAYDPEIRIEREYLRFALNADLRVLSDAPRATAPPPSPPPPAASVGKPVVP